jgi:DNA polymerase-3 subunit alpha (Gram-positive type)
MGKFQKFQLAFTDIETTGLNYKEHEIIEIASIIYDQAKGEVVQEWEKKVAPQHIETASKKALKLNGYINNPDSYTGDLKSALIKLNSIADKCIMVGQNISFDLQFIEDAMRKLDIEPKFDRHRRIDLLSMAWPEMYTKEINGLGLRHLCDYFDVPNIGAHSALVDCRRTLEVYKCLMNIYRGE